MIHAAYAPPDGSPPQDGDDICSTLGWSDWTDYVLARHDQYPGAAPLALWGWAADHGALEHDLERLLHECDDPDVTGVTAQILAALRACPDGATFYATDGEPEGDDGDGESATESRARIFEDGGLVTKQVTVHRSDGTSYQQTRQVRADQADGAEQTHAELHDSDKAEIAGGIDKDVAALPEGQRPPAGLVAKAKDVALTAAAKAYLWAVRATPAMQAVGKVLGEVLDTPSDMAKLGYNPNLSSGTANPKVHDPVSGAIHDALGFGVSGHLVASVASKVLIKTAAWVAKKARAESADEGVSEWAEMIAQLLAHVGAELGVEGQAPDAATVEKGLRALLAARGAPAGSQAHESVFESAGRREGEVWKGPSGHYFTVKSGHTVPAKSPEQKGDARPGTAAGTGPHRATHALHDALASADLPPEQKAKYALALHGALRQMPPAALDRIAANLTGVNFHASTRDIGAAMVEQLAAEPGLTDEQRAEVRTKYAHLKGLPIGGVYMNGFKHIHVDGDNVGGSKGKHSAGFSTARGIYAHELTHAIDGPDQALSQSPEWQAAMRAEILFEKGAEPPLTNYAGSKPSESVAEFGRLVYGSDVPHARIAADFPKATAVFKAHGLWPATERTEGGAPMPELFDQRVEVGTDGTHADVLKAPGAPAK